MSAVLTVVATSRNDGHGGHLLQRMQWFLDGLAFQVNQFDAEVELILVEWNPPSNAPPLSEALEWPAPGGKLAARVITVPDAVHRRLDGADRLPLFQMIAKNVGIRRAEGEYVVATNIDVLFSTPLMGRMLSGLAHGVLYRADRHDVDFPFDREMSVPEALALCEAATIRVMRKDGAYYPGQGRVMPNYGGLVDYACYQPRRLTRHVAARHKGQTDAARRERFLPWAAAKAEAAVDLVRLPKLHTNACGDFTLLSRDDWMALRGYPEWEMFSWNIDSLLLYQASAAGITEVDLPPSMPVFHMEHEKGSGWTPEGRGDLFGRLDAGGVRYLSDRGLRREAVGMLRRSRRGDTTPINPGTWGLADEDLPSGVCTW